MSSAFFSNSGSFSFSLEARETYRLATAVNEPRPEDDQRNHDERRKNHRLDVWWRWTERPAQPCQSQDAHERPQAKGSHPVLRSCVRHVEPDSKSEQARFNHDCRSEVVPESQSELQATAKCPTNIGEAYLRPNHEQSSRWFRSLSLRVPFHTASARPRAPLEVPTFRYTPGL